MRQARLKAPREHEVAYYHCVSRVVDRRFVLQDREKEKFVELMREYTAFCGVRIITYCVMSNHFHILLEVPKAPGVLPTDEELLKRIEGLSGLAGGRGARQILEGLRKAGDDTAAEEFRRKYFERMWDVSGFMKLLKQRFTQWFNLTHGRKGTLWEERFKSVLVEGSGAALATMAAYIDLNPVRAGITNDPKNYRWSGYAEAMAGRRGAKEGLRVVIAGAWRVGGEKVSLTEALEQYRVWMFGQGEERERKGFSREAVAKVVGEKGRVEMSEYLRLRVRYFADGAVLGTRGFVDEVFRTFRSRFGPKRKDGARRMKGVESERLFVLRDLRVDVVG